MDRWDTQHLHLGVLPHPQSQWPARAFSFFRGYPEVNLHLPLAGRGSNPIYIHLLYFYICFHSQTDLL